MLLGEVHCGGRMCAGNGRSRFLLLCIQVYLSRHSVLRLRVLLEDDYPL
jgi:hypothetical protein